MHEMEISNGISDGIFIFSALADLNKLQADTNLHKTIRAQTHRLVIICISPRAITELNVENSLRQMKNYCIFISLTILLVPSSITRKYLKNLPK